MTVEHRKEITLEDGRKAERVVREDINHDTKSGTRITEVWAEPKPPMKKLTQRVIENLEPIIARRELEMFDESGELISKEIESLEPHAKLQVVERLVSSLAIEEEDTSSDNCYVTRDEMRDDICEALKMVLKNGNGHHHHMGYANNKNHCGKGQVSAMQTVLEDRMESKKAFSPLSVFFLVVIVIQVAIASWMIIT